MQDDVYQLVHDGWKAVQSDGPDRGKPNRDLIPEPLIVARYFAKEQAAIEKLEANRDAITRQMEELDEEHGGEDGLLFEARTDKGKLTRASVTARLKEIMYDKEAAEERQKLDTYLGLIEKESAAGKRVKDVQKALDAQVAARYAKLTTEEVQTLVVNDKWLDRLAVDVQGELDRVSQALDRPHPATGRTVCHAPAEAHPGSRGARRSRRRPPGPDGIPPVGQAFQPDRPGRIGRSRAETPDRLELLPRRGNI